MFKYISRTYFLECVQGHITLFSEGHLFEDSVWKETFQNMIKNNFRQLQTKIAWIFIWISYANLTLLFSNKDKSILNLDKRTWTSLTEFGTFTSAVKCFQCSKGFVIPYPTLLNSHLKDGKARNRDCRPTLILPILSD